MSMRRKEKSKTRAITAFSKCAIGAAVAVVLAFQPCLVSSAYGAMGEYDKDRNYPIWDDPDYQYYYYYWEEDIARKITSVTRSYDDGTKYTATYKYNTNGDMTDALIKETDGTTITIKRVYQGERLISSSLSETNASDKSQSTYTTEYGDGTTPNHELSRVQYADKTTESEEIWYFDSSYYPVKEVEVTREGVRTENDYVYTEDGRNLLSYKSTCSDGSEETGEWRYDEEWDSYYYKAYKYDAALKTTYHKEVQLEGDKNTGMAHSMEITSSEEGTHSIESWYRMEDSNITKVITTAPDGSQTIDVYTYNRDGEETLYTKTVDGQPTVRRETVITENETTVTYTGENGLRYVTRESFDPKTSLETEEETITYADGSSSYSKEIYDYNNGRYVLYISREQSADGIETYREIIYAEDDSLSVKTKDENGAILIIKYDSYYEEISRTETLPDGTTKEIFREYDQGGNLLREVTRYSDGGEDIKVHEYNEDYTFEKITVTYRNGISVITQGETRNAEFINATTIFNNGISMYGEYEYADNAFYTCKQRYTFSHGEVAEHSVTITDTATHVVMIYRDGRTETFSVDHNDENYYQITEKQLSTLEKRATAYLKDALAILPETALSPSQPATPSNSSPVLVAGEV